MRSALASVLLALGATSCLSTSDWPETARPPDNVAIRYEERGGGEPAIVFLHGWSCDRQFWTYQIGPFARARHVVAIDLAGHGESEGGRKQWTIEDLGRDVAVVCDHAKLGRVVLVGHSMGASVALEAARLLGDRCVAVVAVDALQNVESRPSEEELQGWLKPLREDFPKAAQAFVRGGAFPPTADKDLVDLVAARIASRPSDIAVPLFEALQRFDAAAALERIQCPVHCIQSAAHATDVEGARKHNPRFDAVTMENVGHFGMLEDPKTFNRLLGEYLAGL